MALIMITTPINQSLVIGMLLYDGDAIVGRPTIDDKVFEMDIVLAKNRIHRLKEILALI